MISPERAGGTQRGERLCFCEGLFPFNSVPSAKAASEVRFRVD